MGDKVLSQEEIDRLLGQFQQDTEDGEATVETTSAAAETSKSTARESSVQTPASVVEPGTAPTTQRALFPFTIPTRSTPVEPFFPPNSINIKPVMKQISVLIQVELGKLETDVQDVLEFGVGSVLKLDRLVDQPLLVRVNGQPFGTGEAVVVEERFGVRLLGLVSPEERDESDEVQSAVS